MNNHKHVIEQVPPDYYQKGIENNLLQQLWHGNKLEEVVKAIKGNKRRDKILDVGSASGWFISEISKRFQDSNCFGIDIYSKGIFYAKKKYPQVEFKVADAHDIPYKDETFDVIVCTEVLEHVDDPWQVVMEIKRVLKTGGLAIIELDSGSWLFSIIWYLWRKSKGRIWNEAHLHSFNVKKLDRLITSCGLKIIKKKKFNFGMAMLFLTSK